MKSIDVGGTAPFQIKLLYPKNIIIKVHNALRFAKKKIYHTHAASLMTDNLIREQYKLGASENNIL